MVLGHWPDLSALASANSSPSQASQGSPCSHGLALAEKGNLVWENIEHTLVWDTWTGKEALHWRVRTGRTCRRWSLPDLSKCQTDWEWLLGWDQSYPGGRKDCRTFPGAVQSRSPGKANAQKFCLATNLNLVLWFDVVLLHLLKGEPHRVLVVGRHHHSHPLNINLIIIRANYNFWGSNTKEGKVQHFRCYWGPVI